MASRSGQGSADDYRDLPFADASFDAVLCLFTSLGYLERDGDVGVLVEFAGSCDLAVLSSSKRCTMTGPRPGCLRHGWERHPRVV